MAEYSNTGRVMGLGMGKYADATRSQNVRKNRTPEQRLEDEASTQRAYESWKAEREARIARLRIPNASELQHKDILM